MIHARFSRLAPTVLAISLAAGGCSTNVTEPDDPRLAVAGTYAANANFGALSVTTVQDGVVTDWIAQGASLDVTLSADGTSSGRLFVPGGDENGGDLDADMAGTWTITAQEVRFEQAADTFMRDMTFTLNGSTLTGQETFGAVTISVSMTRQD